jgi:hypothetical protein
MPRDDVIVRSWQDGFDASIGEGEKERRNREKKKGEKEGRKKIRRRLF